MGLDTINRDRPTDSIQSFVFFTIFLFIVCLDTAYLLKTKNLLVITKNTVTKYFFKM